VAIPEKADGPYKGMDVQNIRPAIYLACTVSGEFCTETYEKLHTTIDYDGLWDLIEAKHVHDSWKKAAIANQEYLADPN
jgi:hypothetical protein